MKPLFILLSVWILTAVGLRSEDWTTTDGKTYKGVTVVKVEPDAVTILDEDGGALVPLSNLPPNLQQKFHYDPAKGAVAAAARVKSDSANARALEREGEQAEAIKQKQLVADAERAKQKGNVLTATNPTPQALHLEVIQVLQNGVLADEMNAGIDPSTEVSGVHFGAGGGQAVDEGAPIYSPSGKTIFIYHAPSGMADGEQITATAYRDGTFAYQDTQGATRTVEKWVAVLGNP